MRPHKHVAPSSRAPEPDRFQQVLGTAVAQYPAPWGTIPVAATAELDRICVAFWDGAESSWRYIERPHLRLSCPGEHPASPNDWNWSAEVALVASRDGVFAVYKRERPFGNATRTALIVDRFGPASAGGSEQGLALLDSTELFVAGGGRGLGRHVWAGWDEENRQLLVLYQGHGSVGSILPVEWTLFLQRVSFDGNTVDASSVQRVVEGGFEFDARLDGRRLVIVHRAEPVAVHFPLILALSDGFTIGSGPDADAVYAPLHLVQFGLDDGAVSTEAIPGGEHPSIQSLLPLIITFDRHHATLVQLITPLVVLPPGRPRFRWLEQGVDKVAWVRHDAGDARGVMLTEDTSHLPLSLAPLSRHARLLELEDGMAVAHTAFDTWPTPVLQVVPIEKGYAVDVLHHRTRIALYRSRIDLLISDTELTVGNRAFEVWDIGHGLIRNPDDLVPGAFAENGQFLPTDALQLSESTVGGVPGRTADNTMGGFLSIDRAAPVGGCFAYTDMGDGGLRVVFAPDIRPLPVPPPSDSEKILRPDQVTGPPIPCDIWVQLDAADWTDADLPGYEVGALRGADRSLGGAIERALDTMFQSFELALGDVAPNPNNGITDADFDAVDAFRSSLVPPGSVDLTAADGQVVTLTLTPGAPLRTFSFDAALQVAGATPNVTWTLVPVIGPFGFIPAGAIFPGGIPNPSLVTLGGNPVTFTPSTPGAHRLSAFFLNAAGALTSAFTDVDVGRLVRDMVWDLHDGVARTPDYRMGDVDFSVLQYDLGFRATRAGDHERVIVGFPATRRTQWRFRGTDGRQGEIDYRALISLSSTDMELRGLQAQVFDVASFSLAFSYARVFTPGMLMRDARFRDPLRGENISERPDETIRRREPLAHAALSAKPIGDSSTPSHTPTIDLSTRLPLVATTVIVAVLVILGATALVSLVLALTTLLAMAAAAGPAGAVLAVAAAVALLVLLLVVLPLVAESYARDQVNAQFENGSIREQLDGQNLLRFGGEGLAEALARKALEQARIDGLDVPAPATNDVDGTGRDRFRGQLFQMVFVADGVCRILLRVERCAEEPEIGVPTPDPAPDDDQIDPPIDTTGRRRYLGQTAIRRQTR